MLSARCWTLFLLCVSLASALPHQPRHLQQDKSARRSFEVPIIRSRGTGVRRRGVSGSIGLGDTTDLLYTVPLKLGSTTTPVNLDSGSSDLWVISDACQTKICRNSTVQSYPSASMSPSNTSVTMTYGDSQTGTFASGPIVEDTVTIAGIAVPQQKFAAIDNTTNPTPQFSAAGILGLGFPSESQIQNQVVNQQFNTPSTTDDFVSTTSTNGPLFARMAMSGELDSPMFGVQLQRDTIDIGGTGTLSIGKLPDGIDNSSLTWVPVRPYKPADGGLMPPTSAPNEVYPFRWEIMIDGVYLDGQKLADSTAQPTGVNPGGVSALIDTGNTVIRGPDDVVQNILSTVSPSFTKAKSNKGLAATLPCSTPHSLAFQIGGKMFPIDPRDFISQAKAGQATTCQVNNLIGTDPPSSGALFSWSVGDPFFKSNFVAFYYGNLTHPSVDPPRIGFKSLVPDNANQLLTQAVQDAVSSGGNFESTSQAAPTASATAASTTLFMAPNSAQQAGASPTGSDSAASPSSSSSSSKNGARPFVSHTSSIWLAIAATIALQVLTS